LLLGLSAALLVFLVHGLFDYFLEFTPTYLLWWIVLASLVAIISPDTRHTTNDR
jgi:beta-lactamase regulating signal transducer with metallopeptidase domain